MSKIVHFPRLVIIQFRKLMHSVIKMFSDHECDIVKGEHAIRFCLLVVNALFNLVAGGISELGGGEAADARF